MSVIQSVFQLIRVLPPQELEKILYGTSILLPDSNEEILQRIDRPLQVLFDHKTCRHFICSDYNMDGDSYRSPWSNCFYPTPSAVSIEAPSGPLREMEVQFNAALDEYRSSYLGGGVSSVFVWSRAAGEEGFAAAFLLHKELSEGPVEGSWSSVHVFEVSTTNVTVQYRLLSTVGLKLVVTSADIGSVDLGASLTEKRDVQKRLAVGLRIEDVPLHHLEVMGPLFEAVESELRKRVEDIYIVKIESILASLRSVEVIDEPETKRVQEDRSIAKNVMEEMKSAVQQPSDISFETKL